MKNSKKILTGVIISLSFVSGLLIGVLVDYPKTDESKLAGTIGRVNNYRNVKVSENDIKLCSELQENNLKQKQILQYYSFHYATSAKLADDIGKALNASEQVAEFATDNKTVIESLTNFNSFLSEARKDILLALSAIKNLSKTGESIDNLLNITNNANNAIAQISFKQKLVIEFIDALSLFFETHNPADYIELKKAHDALLINQVQLAVATKDKPMLKYIDKQKLFCSKDELSQLSASSKDGLTKFAAKDLDELSAILDQEKLKILDTEIIGAVNDVEKLLSYDTEKLGGLEIEDAEKLGVIILDGEKLGRLMDNETLNCLDAEKLGYLSPWIN